MDAKTGLALLSAGFAGLLVAQQPDLGLVIGTGVAVAVAVIALVR